RFPTVPRREGPARGATGSPSSRRSYKAPWRCVAIGRIEVVEGGAQQGADVRGRDGAPEFCTDRRHGFSGESAGDDLGERGERVAAIQRNPVQAHSLLDPHPDGGDLRRPALRGAHPDTGLSRAGVPGDIQVGERGDQRVLQVTYVGDDVEGAGEVKDRIGNE